MEKQVKEGTSVDDIISKFHGICIDIMTATEENYFTLDDFSYKNMKNSIEKIVKDSADTEDPLVIKQAMNSILSLFSEDRDYSKASLENFKRSLNISIKYYEEINKESLAKIAEAINYSNRKLNILDPRCRNGGNLKDLKNNLDNCTITSYGIEQDANMSDEAKKALDRIAKGSIAGSRISNDVFDIMLLEPPITWALNNNNNGVIMKQEKTYLQNTIKYLRPNGIGVLIIPYFKMHRDMCVQISRYYKNVQVRKLCGRDFSEKGLIAIIGQKASNKEIDETIYQSLRRIYNTNGIKDLSTDPFDKLTLPNTETTIDIFRGSILDMDEMDEIVNTSGCMDDFWKAQQVEKISETSQRPLLPFNIGQIGLVLTSGCLDGIIEEGDGNKHIIKGRVSKKSDIERDPVGDNNLEVHETISNRVEINVFLPNGDYKILA
jgi:hypothetical protein